MAEAPRPSSLAHPIPLLERFPGGISDLETGDLLFFHGSFLAAKLLQTACNTPWCHVAMIVRCDSGPNPLRLDGSEDYRRVCLWESALHAGTSRCVVSGRLHNGARLIDLRDCFSQIANVGTMKLRVASDGARWALRRSAVRFVARNYARPYEKDYWNLVRAWWHQISAGCGCVPTPLPRDVSSYFCSELVVETLNGTNVFKHRFVVADDEEIASSVPAAVGAEFTVYDLADATVLNERYVNASAGFEYLPLCVCSVPQLFASPQRIELPDGSAFL